MRIEVIDFPSDPNCELGELRTSLVNALNSAERSVTAAKLLAETIAFAYKQLGTVYKKGQDISHEQMLRNAKVIRDAKRLEVPEKEVVVPPVVPSTKEKEKK